jgi:short-subunit dehydrogenase
MADYRSRYGQWALVLGASEGLGEALAADLARRGMNVAMVARREAAVRAAADRVAAAFGVETRAIAADMADPDILGLLQDRLGGLEIGFLAYNAAAGGVGGGEFIELGLDHHLTNIQVNCVTPTILVHHFAREMAERRRGGIVLCSSMAEQQGLYAFVSYGATKAFEMILGEGLWFELRDHGVDATTFMIGSTYTPNFQRSQQSRGAVFAETRTPENLAEGTPVPQTPEEASGHLFAQLDKEWLPMVYSNPKDEANNRRIENLTRAEKINRMSGPMKASFGAAGIKAAVAT